MSALLSEAQQETLQKKQSKKNQIRREPRGTEKRSSKKKKREKTCTKNWLDEASRISPTNTFLLFDSLHTIPTCNNKYYSQNQSKGSLLQCLYIPVVTVKADISQYIQQSNAAVADAHRYHSLSCAPPSCMQQYGPLDIVFAAELARQRIKS